MSNRSLDTLYYFVICPVTVPHLNFAWCYKIVTNFRQFFFWGGGEGKVGLAINLPEMNHQISVYFIEWKVVIHLDTALIVQCRYVLFCSKVFHRYNIALLVDHISRYSSVCQQKYKSIPGSPRRLWQMVSCKTIIWLAGSHDRPWFNPTRQEFDFKFIVT